LADALTIWGEPQLQAEDELREEAQHEGGRGDQQQREHQQRGVDQLALAQARDHAGGDAEDRLDDHGDDREAERGREGRGALVPQGAAVEADAQVEGEHALEVEQPLDQHVLVEVVLLAQSLLDRRGDRLVAGQGEDRVAGGVERQQVDDQGGAEEDGDHLQQSPPDVPEHVVPFRWRRGLPARWNGPAGGRAWNSGNRTQPVPAVTGRSADHLVMLWYSGTVSQPYSTSETSVE